MSANQVSRNLANDLKKILFWPWHCFGLCALWVCWVTGCMSALSPVNGGDDPADSELQDIGAGPTFPVPDPFAGIDFEIPPLDLEFQGECTFDDDCPGQFNVCRRGRFEPFLHCVEVECLTDSDCIDPFSTCVRNGDGLEHCVTTECVTDDDCPGRLNLCESSGDDSRCETVPCLDESDCGGEPCLTISFGGRVVSRMCRPAITLPDFQVPTPVIPDIPSLPDFAPIPFTPPPTRPPLLPPIPPVRPPVGGPPGGP